MTDQRTRLCVDPDRCEGHGQCAFVAPALLHLNDDGVLVIDQPDVSDCIETAEKAIDACPTSALRLEQFQQKREAVLRPQLRQDKKIEH